ncbi:MAG: hypothetical protein ACE5GE_08375 [Phycisphaerae bacterium]
MSPEFRLALSALGVLVWLWLAIRVAGRLRRARRRRKPATLNPKLAKYGDGKDLVRARRVEASKIVATASTDHLVGYDIVRQIEAVFVDGFRSPEEALEGLKAAAAMKGANAMLNVEAERTAAGRCSGRGDAVVARRIDGTAGEALETSDG